MRIGVFGGVINDGTIDDVVAEARLVEEQGFASYWAPQIFGHDALTALAVVGREVPRIELGTSVVPTYPRHPMMLAQQALTTNAASGGRLCLGIGLSHQIVIESMMGMSFAKPVRHLREYLAVLGPLSRGEPVAFDGEDYRVHAGISVAGSSPFPIVVAALGPQMLKATAELADGTLTWCTGPETLATYTIPTITEAAEAAGRPAPRVIAALPVCVTDDVAAAHERAAKVFAVYGQLPSYRAMLDREGASGAADIAIIGRADEVSERVAALADVGITDFAAVEFGGNPDEVDATRAAIVATLSG
ncbi:MAG: LLM class F420-dependent oxidoreductase [Ilumatobacteraceae bacterium]